MAKRKESKIHHTYQVRREVLKGMTYEDYLKSDHWAKIKKRKLKNSKNRVCRFCGNQKVEFHHITYKRMLEDFAGIDIIPLCRKHHNEVHEHSKKNGKSVRFSTNEIRKKYDRRKKLEKVKKNPLALQKKKKRMSLKSFEAKKKAKEKREAERKQKALDKLKLIQLKEGWKP